MTESDGPRIEPIKPLWRSSLELEIQMIPPQSLVALWEQEKPWEAKKPEKGFFRRLQPPYLHMPPITEPNDSLKIAEGRPDVRAWALSKLGFDLSQLSHVGISKYQAQALLSEGLTIPPFQAALFDILTQSGEPEEVARTFKTALLEPEKIITEELTGKQELLLLGDEQISLVPTHLFSLAEKIGKLTRGEWEAINEYMQISNSFADILEEASIKDISEENFRRQYFAQTPLAAALLDITNIAVADAFDDKYV